MFGDSEGLSFNLTKGDKGDRGVRGRRGRPGSPGVMGPPGKPGGLGEVGFPGLPVRLNLFVQIYSFNHLIVPLTCLLTG